MELVYSQKRGKRRCSTFPSSHVLPPPITLCCCCVCEGRRKGVRVASQTTDLPRVGGQLNFIFRLLVVTRVNKCCKPGPSTNLFIYKQSRVYLKLECFSQKMN